MCDHHQLRQQPVGGEMCDVNELSQNIGQLLLCDDYSDVCLVVGSTRLPAHKVILAARSEYFRALLFGGLLESRSDCCEVELKETNACAFKHILRYVYTAQMSLVDMQEDTILDVLGLAHRYGFTQLETSISGYLKAVLTVANVCLIFDIARLYSLTSLSQTCCEFMNRNAAEIIHSQAFLSLSMSALREVISWDALCATEIEIFEAVQRWVRHNEAPPPTVALIVSALRLPLMRLDQLLNVVRPSRLLSPDAILDAIQFKNNSRDTQLNYRGFLVAEENIATLRYGAQVICGEMKSSLLDGDALNYDLDKGFTRHPIDDNQGQGIVVKLAKPCIINTVRLLLWDKDMRSYSYYVEVSMDDKDWVRVIDHTTYLCRSWQYLRFHDRVVRFVRVVGTHNTVNRVFHLVAFECLYSRQAVTLDNGIIAPQENIATTKASACVVEGVSRSRNALINGDTNNYDWDSGYTCHQLGSGAVLVQLAQPYMLSSMRLLLWDCDGRSYSYYTAVSTNQQSWTVVADKSKVACKSWQTIVFPKQPVTSIKIVGTHNTANEVFHCVHFETPADSNALASYLSESCVAPPGPASVPSSVPSSVAMPTTVPQGMLSGTTMTVGPVTTMTAGPAMTMTAGPATTMTMTAGPVTTSAQTLPMTAVAGRTPHTTASTGALPSLLPGTATTHDVTSAAVPVPSASVAPSASLPAVVPSTSPGATAASELALAASGCPAEGDVNAADTSPWHRDHCGGGGGDQQPTPDGMPTLW